MNNDCLLIGASWSSSPQKEIALSLQENDNLLQTTFTYPTDIPPLNSTVKTLIPFDDSLSPLVNLETRTSSSITISRSTTLSSSSSEKSFDPFGLTYFSNLIPSLLAPDTSTEIKESTTLDTTTNDQPSSNKELYQLVSTSTIPAAVFNTYGDLFDDTDEEDDHFLYNLIDLNLLDDYALDSTASTSDSEPSLTTYTDGHLSNFRDTSMMIHDLPLFPSPTTTTAITTSPTYLSSSFSSLSSASSSSTISSSATFTTSPSMMMNIWTNNYSRYHDPFDDDEFDPTQPLSSTSPPSLSSSPETSTLSPPYSYQSTAASLSTATGTTAIDMLMALLPHYTRQQVVSTLSSANYDMDHLLVLLSSDGRSSVSYTKKRQICRHFLMGDCLRQDCRFAHDISIKVCRF
ncbi:hypothetical protein BC941DRAFT_92594 [Chlamydoabsidia padenii]|nr:hypothetical protein BC941DRAFT_92594 [Chlamydoabsidia padenii]